MGVFDLLAYFLAKILAWTDRLVLASQPIVVWLHTFSKPG